MHRDVVAEALEVIGAGNEIAFAIDFDEHADFTAGVNVVADHAFASGALGLLLRGGLALFAQNVDGLLDITLRFDQCFAAGGKAGAGALAELLYKCGRYVGSCLAMTCVKESFSDFSPRRGKCGEARKFTE